MGAADPWKRFSLSLNLAPDTVLPIPQLPTGMMSGRPLACHHCDTLAGVLPLSPLPATLQGPQACSWISSKPYRARGRLEQGWAEKSQGLSAQLSLTIAFTLSSPLPGGAGRSPSRVLPPLPGGSSELPSALELANLSHQVETPRILPRGKPGSRSELFSSPSPAHSSFPGAQKGFCP